MADQSITGPISFEDIYSAVFDGSGETYSPNVLPICAFLLLAGAAHSYQFADIELVPYEELAATGLGSWQPERALEAPMELRDFDDRIFDELEPDYSVERRSRPEYYRYLYDRISTALETGSVNDTALAVATGLRSPDALVRASALRSAVDLFRLPPQRIFREAGWLAARRYDQSPVAAAVTSISLSTSVGYASIALGNGYGASAIRTANLSDYDVPILAIHGTNMPGSRPDWSVPDHGPLWMYLRANRNGPLNANLNFRWEGGYSDYAREVAADNLVRHIHLHGLVSDAVCHSHGGNVLLQASHQGVQFQNVVLASCPVHFHKYWPASGSMNSIQSVRTFFDFVILADRGAQRFPGEIPEHVLPFWYVGHGKPVEVDAWQYEHLLRYLS